MNHNGMQTTEEPLSFWAQPTNQTTPQYGPLANNKAVDAVIVTTAATFTAVGQDGNSIVFPAFPVGTVLPISPAWISAGAANIFVAWK